MSFFNPKRILARLIISGMILAIGPKNAHPSQKVFSLDLPNTTPLQALVSFSSQNRLPLGIVLSDQPSLCTPQKRISFVNVTAENVLDGVLLDSGYHWLMENGVFVVKPVPADAMIDRVLQLRYPRFQTMDTTMQGLGVILSGYIQASLDPSQGFAGNILSSSESTRVKPFVLENLSVEQIANYIVSLDEKGAWVLSTEPQKPNRKISLNIYGYKDNASILAHFPCPTPQPATK